MWPLAEIARRYSATPARIALAWLLRRSPVILPIPGTLMLDHLPDQGNFQHIAMPMQIPALTIVIGNTVAGIEFKLKLPSERFNRHIGVWEGQPHDPAGARLSASAWQARQGEYLPGESDRLFVQSLMKPVTEPGKMARWIAPPERGVNSLAVDHEYVRL